MVKEVEGPKKTVRYIDRNVYEEAKLRIRHIVDTFDDIYVSFSGGKDSLVTLLLLREVLRDMGIDKKINVVFRDEELIPDDVIDFLTEIYRSGEYNFYWFAVQMKSHKFILGKSIDYLQWDEKREWVREKPEWAIEAPGKVFDQYTMDKFVADYVGAKGKVAFMTGIRADESITRFNSCVNKINENYINQSPTAKNVKLVKPIYDWSEKDIFKYLHDNGHRYCPVYDKQVWNSEGLRVATPVHAENAKKFDKLRTLAPRLYQQVVQIMPEMMIQERYWKEYDRYGIIERYPHSWAGIAKYIRDNIPDAAQRQLASKRVRECITIRQNKLKKGEGLHNMGGYPILYVFRTIVNGQYKRAIQPLNKAGKIHFEFEGMEIPEE